MNSRFLPALILTLALAATGSAATITFANNTAITIPASGTGAASGSPSTPYPSDIAVSGFSGGITTLTVMLMGLSHTNPDDIDILLVGPAGDKYILMSDAGGSTDVFGINLLFSDAATNQLPDSSILTSGTFKPTDYDTAGDLNTFPGPAPNGPYISAAPTGTSTLASIFNGQNPNGIWSLFIVDDASPDAGSLSGGWAVTITAAAAAAVPEPSSVVLLGSGLFAALVFRRRFAK